MNFRVVYYTVGKILQIEAAILLLPFIVSLCYWEKKSIYAFLMAVAIAFIIGVFLTYVIGKNDDMIFACEGFAIVAVAWIAMSVIGAMPFVIGGAIHSYADAIFETVSGFTTTGATILDNIEALSHVMLFRRSFTQWLGGMGVLVFIMAILPQDLGLSMHIMRAEMPGPDFQKRSL